MKKHILNLMAIVVVTSLSILPTFADQSKTDLLTNNTVTIEQNASKYAKVTNIKVFQHDSETRISGKVILVSKNIPAKHRKIPGHVDITLIDTNGNSTKLASVHYNKINHKSRFAKFSYKFASTPKSGSKLVITHNPNNYN